MGVARDQNIVVRRCVRPVGWLFGESSHSKTIDILACAEGVDRANAGARRILRNRRRSLSVFAKACFAIGGEVHFALFAWYEHA